MKICRNLPLAPSSAFLAVAGLHTMAYMQLFHFSEEPGIEIFHPRPVLIPSKRKEGRDWLNGPLVWAIDETHAMLYLFPRDCPRIVVWPTRRSTEQDRLVWMGETPARAVAYVEHAWRERLQTAVLYRYAMPEETFEDIADVGMWVSRTAVRPSGMEELTAPDERLAESGVEVRWLDDLTPLRPLWSSTLHVSGLRLRNAANWHVAV